MQIRMRHGLVAVVVAGMVAGLSACGGASDSEASGMDAAQVKDKLVAAGLTCGDDSISPGVESPGVDPFSTVECYTDTGWYQVDVWETIEGLQSWWSARCKNESADPEPRAVGAYWSTDIQSTEEAQTIADALDGQVKSTQEWCASPDDIGR